MTTTQTGRKRAGARPEANTGRFRADIQGLRALAVTMVVLYHLWPNRLTGGFVGVDVFFVISGFLITSHLMSKPPQTLHGLGTFWARRIRRLLPAALLVLAVVTIAIRVFAPVTQWKNWSGDVIAAAIYGVNWKLAAASVDYLQAENAASPVQHFWSLSVEEQFYIIWPILIGLVVLLAVARKWNMKIVVLIVLSVVSVASLMYSIVETAESPASAFFITPTRIWELGAGGVLAAVLAVRSQLIPKKFFVPAVRVILGWLGVGAVLISAVFYSASTPFPGSAALLPVLGTVAVIAARPEPHRFSTSRYLGLPPAQWLGDVSYSLYLWHWPLIIFVPFVSDGHLGRLDKLLILVVALILAGLSKRYVEDRFRWPARGSRLWRTFVAGAAGMAIVVGIGAVPIAEATHREQVAQAELQRALSSDTPCFGAAAMVATNECALSKTGPVVPAPAKAAVDKSAAYPDGCWVWIPFNKDTECTYGDPHGSISIALVGNSHAGEWVGPLDAIAKKKGWKITTFIASECMVTPVKLYWDTAGNSAGCKAWGERVMKATTSGKFDVIVTAERNGTRAVAAASLEDSQSLWKAGYKQYLQRWTESGVQVVVIRDNPFPANTMGSVPDCVASHIDSLLDCSGTPKGWLPRDPLVDAARSLSSERASVVDLTRFFCNAKLCPGVIGGVVTYFDNSHITNTFAMTLAPYLVKPLDDAVAAAQGRQPH